MAKKRRSKILVAMSGGVDSSVAAWQLLRQGDDVTGAFMVNYGGGADARTGASAAGECWVPEYRDALRVAAYLGIPLLRLDFTREYRQLVLSYLYREYRAGRTPNPDVLCNRQIKFGAWLDTARRLGFAQLATGHYAQILAPDRGHQFYRLGTARDKQKDQTYFLHQLTQNQLQAALFPVGGYTKSEVRQLARRAGLPTAEKEESMGICFVGEVPMKDFLGAKIPPHPGRVVTAAGQVIGQHQGLPFYTIGQRHIGVNCGGAAGDRQRPLYVAAKRPRTNELIVAEKDDPTLLSREFTVAGINWISGHRPAFPLECKVRLRHRQPWRKCRVLALGRRTKVICARPEWGVTPGQFAVFYDDFSCLGGGAVK
ncbi:MAG: tRNA-specific 2-thiouridylase MnmA [Candidatus Magasanikbacteria bacterium GW2011_GWA2_56_11]|uniref:tRNA-specific 2-thiouridylase MnmA n=1 Tax=Candidatus Magasanikbacteria bacterium GW2011_GWA2_56_11 TaxID=1619044 RepID=A0A0G1YDR9_9BACT|nr:MAG: tRNA-specific 2-thiouridylase MnmA [Candidatus Magasanikbacteria bacterium GW2011_GWA2_56_11]